MERQRERDRYQEWVNDQDSEKMPRAFDHGWRRNLAHLFGDNPLLWPIPVCTTTGDGWRWEPSTKFLEARERIRISREQEASNQQQYYRDLYSRNMDNGHAWGVNSSNAAQQSHQPSSWIANRRPQDAPERPPTSVSMQTLAPASPRPRPGDSDFEDEPEGNGLLDPEAGRGQSVKQSGQNKDTDEWRDWDD
jgi:palmitoyltransferase